MGRRSSQRISWEADLRFPSIEEPNGPTDARSSAHRKLFGAFSFPILVTSAFAPILGMDWKIGALVASMAMAGDLFSSFLKRRFNLHAGDKATGLDQIPESLFPLLACRGALSFTALDIVAGVVFFFVGELLLSRVFYYFHLRDRPY